MTVVRAADAVVHDLHGARFTAYATPAHGSRELRAWRLQLPAGSTGVPHTVSREEVLLVLDGALQVSLDGRPAQAATVGDAVVVPPGSLLRIDNAGGGTATAWVTTSAGMEATLPDGSRITPPWAR